MPLIWRLRLHGSQKMAVLVIGSLALITIAFETVRSVKLYTTNFNLTNLYSYLELLVAVIICQLPAYRFLFSGDNDKSRESNRRLFWSRITFQTSQAPNATTTTNYSMDSFNRDSRGADGGTVVVRQG